MPVGEFPTIGSTSPLSEVSALPLTSRGLDHGATPRPQEPEHYTPERLALHGQFFSRLIERFGLTKVPNADIVAVMHMFPDAYPFIAAMQQIADIHTIIPKRHSIKADVRDNLQEVGLPIQRLARDEVRVIVSSITHPTVFMDIGGWFADIIPQLQEAAGENFRGVVEDTENGHQKYIDTALDFPYHSAARSPLKEYEDKIVGRNIADATEDVLAELKTSIQGLEVGVIGYGKIGRSFASRMREKGGTVNVCDINNDLLRRAASANFVTRDKASVLAESDIICVANGNKSIKGREFAQVKQGAWIVSVTSADDALDTRWLDDKNNPYKKETVQGSDYVTKYINPKTDHYFYMIADGNPINLVLKKPVGDHILLVHGELLVGAYRLLTGQVAVGKHEIDPEARDAIRDVWIETFGREALENI